MEDVKVCVWGLVMLQPLEVLLLVSLLLVDLLRSRPLLRRPLPIVEQLVGLLCGSNLRDLKVSLIDGVDARVHLCVLHKVLVPERSMW